jgi:hypothetical protein
MTDDEKLKHIESALAKVLVMSEGRPTDTFSSAECYFIKAGLDIAAAVCVMLKGPPR